VLRDASVRCWGSGQRGQLGNGAAVQRHTPVVVTGLSGVVQVVAGNVHSCALTATGAVRCWGANSAGQLGDGTTTDRSIPVDVVGLGSGVAAITAGFQHTCALTTAGGVKCWGRNNWGQMGNNDVNNTQFTTPVDVTGLGAGVLAVDADVGDTVCALLSGGSVKCWGLNANGDVGDGTSGTTRRLPVDVVGLSSGVVAIAAKCAVLAPARALKCWGTNASGQIGDGTTTARTTPTAVVGYASDTRQARGPGSHRCGISVSGALQCWGSNTSGQLGDGTTTARLVPGAVLYDGDPVFGGGFEAPSVP
jgi:alpha-tubulin suppressor-like RCC1 family protein